ncbi:hypothetical protein LCGC14_0504100 [marine sediment metagenome]|uniref:Uncharacterized protein n=1 Tax=marine sediment metagenome TaxID=412755 RepID=A0A0F9S317_9ZZZZ
MGRRDRRCTVLRQQPWHMLKTVVICLLAEYGITDYKITGYWSETSEYFYVIAQWYHYTNRQTASLTICWCISIPYKYDRLVMEWKVNECKENLDRVVETYGHAQMEQSYVSNA